MRNDVEIKSVVIIAIFFPRRRSSQVKINGTWSRSPAEVIASVVEITIEIFRGKKGNGMMGARAARRFAYNGAMRNRINGTMARCNGNNRSRR